MMKHFLIGLITCCTFMTISAGIVTDAMISRNGDLGIAHALAGVDAATAKQELAAVKDKFAASTSVGAKASFAAATAIAYGKENPNASYSELVAKYDECLEGLNCPPDMKTNNEYRNHKIGLVHRWFCGSTNVARIEAAIEANKADVDETTAFELAQLMKTLNRPVEEYGPLYMKSTRGQNFLMRDYLNTKNYEKASELFFPLLTKGALEKDDAMNAFTKILPYAMAQDDFDPATLKSQLSRGIIIYKTKARQWKPSKEGETNPWLAFVGALQDTVKDL